MDQDYSHKSLYADIAGVFSRLTGATAASPQIAGLFETLIGAYQKSSGSQILDRITALTIIEDSPLRTVIAAHSPGGADYVEHLDRIYAMPEVLLIADLALTRPRLLEHTVRNTDFAGIPAMGEELAAAVSPRSSRGRR